MRQRGNPPQRSQRWSCPLSVQGVWVLGAVRAGRRGQSGAVRAGRGPVSRAQFPAQHRPGDGRGADDDCQAAKKKRRSPRCSCPDYARKRRSARSWKSWKSMSSGASWATNSAGLVVACGRTGPAAHRGLDAGQPGRSPVAPALAVATPPVSPPLLIFYRPVESLRQGAAALAAPALCQGRGPDQHRRSHQLLLALALRRARAQVLLLQQILGHAYGPN